MRLQPSIKRTRLEISNSVLGSGTAVKWMFRTPKAGTVGIERMLVLIGVGVTSSTTPEACPAVAVDRHRPSGPGIPVHCEHDARALGGAIAAPPKPTPRVPFTVKGTLMCAG